jgi:hypothetical protein
VVLHETIHKLHRKKLDGVMFKIDFEKTYKFNWSFLQQALHVYGFGWSFNPTIYGLTPHIVEGGVSILQYIDDTIIFYHNLEKALNMKIILCFLSNFLVSK